MRRVLVAGTAVIAALAACTSLAGNDGGAAGALAGSVSIGPICPVEREDEPCPVPPELYAGVRVHVRSAASGRTVARAALDDRGRYRIDLRAGSYLVRLEHALGIDRGAGEPTHQVRVAPGETAVLDFAIDTGIR